MDKSRFRELSTDQTTEKNRKYHTGSDKKSHELWFEIILWYSEVSLQI